MNIEEVIERFDVNFFGYPYPEDCCFGDDVLYEDVQSFLRTELENAYREGQESMVKERY